MVEMKPFSAAAKRRAEAADPNGMRCLIENCPQDRAVELVHVFPRESDESVTESLEWCWKMPRGTLNLDSRRNIVFLGASLQALFKRGMWTLMPEESIVNRYWHDRGIHSCPRIRDIFPPELTEPYFQYKFVPISGMETFGITRQTEHPPTQEGFTNYVYPFTSFPTVTSHMDPKFAILHMGASLSDHSEEPSVVRLLEDPVILRILRIYRKWVGQTILLPVSDRSWLSQEKESDLEDTGSSDEGSDSNSQCTLPRRLAYQDDSHVPAQRRPDAGLQSSRAVEASSKRGKGGKVSSSAMSKLHNTPTDGWTKASISAWARKSNTSPPLDPSTVDVEP